MKKLSTPVQLVLLFVSFTIYFIIHTKFPQYTMLGAIIHVFSILGVIMANDDNNENLV